MVCYEIFDCGPALVCRVSGSSMGERQVLLIAHTPVLLFAVPCTLITAMNVVYHNTSVEENMPYNLANISKKYVCFIRKEIHLHSRCFECSIRISKQSVMEVSRGYCSRTCTGTVVLIPSLSGKETREPMLA